MSILYGSGVCKCCCEAQEGERKGTGMVYLPSPVRGIVRTWTFQEEPKNTSIHLVRPPGREFATTESVLYDEHRDAVR
jgi:hypothetical protein